MNQYEPSILGYYSIQGSPHFLTSSVWTVKISAGPLDIISNCRCSGAFLAIEIQNHRCVQPSHSKYGNIIDVWMMCPTSVNDVQWYGEKNLHFTSLHPSWPLYPKVFHAELPTKKGAKTGLTLSGWSLRFLGHLGTSGATRDQQAVAGCFQLSRAAPFEIVFARQLTNHLMSHTNWIRSTIKIRTSFETDFPCVPTVFLFFPQIFHQHLWSFPLCQAPGPAQGASVEVGIPRTCGAPAFFRGFDGNLTGRTRGNIEEKHGKAWKSMERHQNLGKTKSTIQPFNHYRWDLHGFTIWYPVIS